MMIITNDFISFFCLKHDKIKFLSCIFPKKYAFLVIYKEPEPAIFFNAAAAPAPLKKGGSYRLRLPSPVFNSFQNFMSLCAWLVIEKAGIRRKKRILVQMSLI